MTYKYTIGGVTYTRPSPWTPSDLAAVRAGHAAQDRANRLYQESPAKLEARIKEYKAICKAMGRKPIMEYPRGPAVLAVIGNSRIEIEHTATGNPLDKWMTLVKKHKLLAA